MEAIDPIAMEIKPEAPGDLRYKDRRLIVLYFDMGAIGSSELRVRLTINVAQGSRVQGLLVDAAFSRNHEVGMLQAFVEPGQP